MTEQTGAYGGDLIDALGCLVWQQGPERGFQFPMLGADPIVVGKGRERHFTLFEHVAVVSHPFPHGSRVYGLYAGYSPHGTPIRLRRVRVGLGRPQFAKQALAEDLVTSFGLGEASPVCNPLGVGQASIGQGVSVVEKLVKRDRWTFEASMSDMSSAVGTAPLSTSRDRPAAS